MRLAFRRHSTYTNGEMASSRWLHDESFCPAWEYRSVFAAAMCADSRSVCDIGCGMQSLRSFLPKGVRYLPADLVKRSDDTEVCDLNRKQLPTAHLSRADTVTLLGVIEYLLDPAWVFESLSPRIEKIVVSYVPVDLLKVDRRKRGWVNDFSAGDIVKMLHAADFQLRDMTLCDSTQILFLGGRRLS